MTNLDPEAFAEAARVLQKLWLENPAQEAKDIDYSSLGIPGTAGTETIQQVVDRVRQLRQCSSCKPSSPEENHPIGMIFVGWGARLGTVHHLRWPRLRLAKLALAGFFRVSR